MFEKFFGWININSGSSLLGFPKTPEYADADAGDKGGVIEVSEEASAEEPEPTPEEDAELLQ